MNTRRAFQLILLLAGLVFAILSIRSVLGSQVGARFENAYAYPPPPVSPTSESAPELMGPYPPPSTPAPVPTPVPNQKLSPEAQKAVAYISAKEQIDPKFLVVDADHPTEYPNLGRRFQVVSMFDPRPGGEGYKLLVDLDTGEVITDIVSLLEAEREARFAKYGKYDETLHEALQTLKDDDLVKVVIWVTSEPGKDMHQIEAEAFAVLADKYPEAQEAMEKSGVAYDVEDAELGKKLLKEYIQLIRAPIEKRKQPLLETLEAAGFESTSPKGLPAIYVSLTKKDLLDIADRDDVGFISLDEGFIEQETLDSSVPSSGAPAAWANGYNGTGVNLAILDGGNVDFTSPDGSECPQSSHNCFLNVYPVSLSGHLGLTDHATEAAGAAVSNHATYRGMAPGATIMSAGIPAPGGVQQALNALQWAIDQDADIINNSFMYCSYGDNLLHNIDRAYDHYARWENKMVVISSGNHQDVCPYFVTSPAKGWNVISVGAYIDSNDASWSNDSIWVDSCYINPASPHNDHEKPEVAAPGGVISVIGTNGIIHSGLSGTSLAAPHVSGLAALLIDRNPNLVLWPVSSRAIIMASAVHNLDGPRGIPTGTELRDGAGGIDVSLADKVAATRCTSTQCDTPGWWGLDINNTNFPIGSILDRKFPASTGQLVRVAIAWWSDVQCLSIQNCSYDELRTDLDLYIRFIRKHDC